jgi:hypothetical protein
MWRFPPLSSQSCLYKGGDKAEIRLVKMYGDDDVEDNLLPEVDQIKEYMDCRYLSAQEVAWRIFDYPTNNHSNHVERLPMSNQPEQQVVFQEGYHESAADSPPPTTKLSSP